MRKHLVPVFLFCIGTLTQTPASAQTLPPSEFIIGFKVDWSQTKDPVAAEKNVTGAEARYMKLHPHSPRPDFLQYIAGLRWRGSSPEKLFLTAPGSETHRPERLYILVGGPIGWKLGQMPKTFSPESYYCAKKEPVAQDLFDFWRSQGEAPKLARIPDPIEPGPDTVGRDVMPKCGPGVKPPCATQ